MGAYGTVNAPKDGTGNISGPRPYWVVTRNGIPEYACGDTGRTVGDSQEDLFSIWQTAAEVDYQTWRDATVQPNDSQMPVNAPKDGKGNMENPQGNFFDSDAENVYVGAFVNGIDTDAVDSMAQAEGWSGLTGSNYTGFVDMADNRPAA